MNDTVRLGGLATVLRLVTEIFRNRIRTEQRSNSLRHIIITGGVYGRNNWKSGPLEFHYKNVLCEHTVKASTGVGISGGDLEHSRRSPECRNFLELDCRPDRRAR